jgi:uncharacterized protein YkwD
MYKNISLTIIMASAIAAILIVPWAALQRSHAQSDLSSTILDIHNRERAAVSPAAPPLVWSDSLAAGAKTWAEHLATTGEFVHEKGLNVAENIAGFFKGVSAPGEGQSMWVDEKAYWNGSTHTCTAPPGKVCGHYTNMIGGYKEVGCGTASGSGHKFSILVCRYT